MSLLVWLPLDGDTVNKGLDPDYDTPTSNRSYPVFVDGGNVGSKALNPTTTTSGVLSYAKTLSNEHSYTMCAWVKYTGNITSSRYILWTGSDSGGYGFGIRMSGTSAAQCVVFGSTINLTIGNNEWHHVALVIDYENLKFSGYLDGVLIDTKTYTPRDIRDYGLNVGWLRPSFYPFLGLINDVRIYDHALSPKEINDLSQALILHYPLTAMVNENLVSSLKSYSPTEYLAYQFNLSENFVASQKYTFQLWDVDVSHTGKTESQLGIGIFWGGADVVLKNLLGDTWFTNGHADYIEFTITISSTQASGTGATNSWINIYNSPYSADGTRNMHIGHIKVEKGSVATPHNGSGESQTVVYDSSGYSRNGTVTGTLSSDNDAPRYTTTTSFNGTSYIQVASPSTEVRTIAFWAKWNSIPSGQSVVFVDQKSKIGFGIMSTGLLCSTNGVTTYTFPKTDIVAKTWYHFVIVNTSDSPTATTRDLYINGVKQTATSRTSNWTFPNSLDYLQIGKRSTTSDGFSGMISDFRMYSTTLSEPYIVDLYNSPVYIDNLGTMSAYEFIENSDNGQSIEKTGIVGVKNLIEYNDSLKLMPDGSVFLKLLRHNNPASKLFTEDNCWLNSSDPDLYSSLILLKNIDWMKNLETYEFLACEKLTSSDSETRVRWTQTSNPALTSTATGYTLVSGSAEKLTNGLANAGTHGCFDVSGNYYWCCCGSYTAYQGGSPGFNGVVKTGYTELYIRIPDEMIKGYISGDTKFYKQSITTTQLKEI